MNVQIVRKLLKSYKQKSVKIEDNSKNKVREKNYSCVTIKKESVINQKLDDDLIAFMTTKEDKIAKIGQENCFIPSRYIEIVKEGVKNFSKEFQDNFEDIFSNFPFEIKEGIYTFSDPIQNQAAKNSKRL